MKAEELPIPDVVKEKIASLGIDELYPPQEEAFTHTDVLKGKNALLASPTASGKTLVAEVCALKHIIERRGKVLYLTPLRALASEKYREFQKYEGLTGPHGEPIRVGISTGDLDSADPWLARYDIIVSTNEKADSLLRHRAPWISDISLVVADEVHFISDAERGPTLEVVLAKLMLVKPTAQILALSATVRNADEVAQWLKADHVTMDWRPVKLREGVYCQGEVKFNDGHAYRLEEAHPSPVVDLAMKTVKEGGQALVFTDTRRAAVEFAKRLGPAVKKALSPTALRRLALVSERILGADEKTRISELLASLIQSGVAFHHAGLSGAHRSIIEDSFRSRQIKVLCATPTLAAGVNLPARTVIISSYERYERGYGRYPIPVLEYKQMSGRAGRPKYDRIGESILVARSGDEEDYLMENYVNAKPERLWSKLGAEPVLRSHTLATIASGLARSEQGLFDFFEKTLYAFQYGPEQIKPVVTRALKFLFDQEMVEGDGRELDATSFGKRVSELYIDPLSAVIVRDGLWRGAKRTTDFSFLHLVAHTPDVEPKPFPRGREIAQLESQAEAHKDEFMVDLPDPAVDNIAYNEFLTEVKCAAVLEAWINEVSEDDIIERFGVEPGDLFRMLDSANWLLFATHEIAALFNLRELTGPLTQLSSRVRTGVKPELLVLTELQGIGRVRGRLLYNHGFRTIEDLKRASMTDLMNVPLIGSRVAKSIKDQVGGKVSSQEIKRLKEGWESEQTLLTEFR
ncbi:MAG: DEAD/DEAH box helicase [Candidatus Bathyarchaeia archaeon]